MDIAACPRCASIDLRMPTLQDGVWPGGGETNVAVCAACAFRGVPFLFQTQKAYMAFRSSVAAGPRPARGRGAAQRVMPLFIAIAGAMALVGAAALALSAFWTPAAPALRMADAFGVAVAVLLGVAFLRVAYRAWRPRAA